MKNKKILIFLIISLCIISCFDDKKSEKKELKKISVEKSKVNNNVNSGNTIFSEKGTTLPDLELKENDDKKENILSEEDKKYFIKNQIDPSKVEEAIKEAKNGNKESIMSLAQLYYELNNKNKAKEYLEIGAKKNYPEAIYNLAILYKEEGNTKKANELLSKLPKYKEGTQKLTPAAVEYNRGIDLIKNKKYKEAKKVFESAYKNGIKEADIQIALINKQQKNYSDAIKWFKKALNRGVKEANYEIGALLFDSKKEIEARPYLLKAYKMGAKELAMPIAISYHKEDDLEKALKWYKIASNNGDEDAKEVVKEFENMKSESINIFDNNKVNILDSTYEVIKNNEDVIKETDTKLDVNENKK